MGKTGQNRQTARTGFRHARSLVCGAIFTLLVSATQFAPLQWNRAVALAQYISDPTTQEGAAQNNEIRHAACAQVVALYDRASHLEDVSQATAAAAADAFNSNQDSGYARVQRGYRPKDAYYRGMVAASQQEHNAAGEYLAAGFAALHCSKRAHGFSNVSDLSLAVDAFTSSSGLFCVSYGHDLSHTYGTSPDESDRALSREKDAIEMLMHAVAVPTFVRNYAHRSWAYYNKALQEGPHCLGSPPVEW
ncbi:MAG: hypothetical protein ACYDDQ_02425 [Vulcanimicrobiaceae bacterium]